MPNYHECQGRVSWAVIRGFEVHGGQAGTTLWSVTGGAVGAARIQRTVAPSCFAYGGAGNNGGIKE